MALNRATYLEHVRRIFGRTVEVEPEEAQGPLIEALTTYADRGSLGTRQERIEAGQIVLNMFWQTVLNQPYNEHQMQHWVVRWGGPANAPIPNLPEPTV